MSVPLVLSDLDCFNSPDLSLGQGFVAPSLHDRLQPLPDGILHGRVGDTHTHAVPEGEEEREIDGEQLGADRDRGQKCHRVDNRQMPKREARIYFSRIVTILPISEPFGDFLLTFFIKHQIRSLTSFELRVWVAKLRFQISQFGFYLPNLFFLLARSLEAFSAERVCVRLSVPSGRAGRRKSQNEQTRKKERKIISSVTKSTMT